MPAISVLKMRSNLSRVLECFKGNLRPERVRPRFQRPAMRMIVMCCMLLVAPAVASAQDRETKVRNDQRTTERGGRWVYNDFPQGVAEARRSGKPLLVTIRCIPCEACAQLDAQIVNRDPAVQKLLDEFVCVRIVQANGLDLSLFQYDYDQSFAAFFLNADKTIYGRYGTRSHATESEQDVTVAGFAEALAGALELHKGYPANKKSLAAKRGPEPEILVPEEFPSLAGKYGPKLDFTGQVVKSCIHCHQVGEAGRHLYIDKGRPIPEALLYPYPHPAIFGLTLDPDHKATVLKVAPDSTAAKDGFLPGDKIVSLEGQPLLSIADIQWVLHRAGDSGRLRAEVLRGNARIELPLSLDPGWRRRGDISWRVSSWDLRRMAFGGMRLEQVATDERQKLGLPDDSLALCVRHVGEHGAHAIARKAGFRKGDILVEIAGDATPRDESQLLVAFLERYRSGDRVPFVVLRDGVRLELTLPIP